MKNKLFITILSSLFVTISFAQLENVKSLKSDIFKDKKRQTNLAFVEDDGNGGLVTFRSFYNGLGRKLKGYYIEHFDNNLKLIKETEFEIENNSNIDNAIRGVIIENGLIKLLEYNRDRKANKYEFNVLTSSLESLNFKRAPLFSLGEEEIKEYFGVGFSFLFFGNGYSEYDSNALGEVSFSENKNFIAFNFDIKNKDRETHRIFVYNKNLEQVNVHEFKKDIKDKLFVYENVEVDDIDGSVYFLGKVFENNTNKFKKNGKANYHYELYKLSGNEQKMVSFKTDGNYVGSLTTVRAGKKLSCVGFYGEKDDWKYKGICRFDMNFETLEIENKSFNEFSDQFMTDKYGDREKKKKKELRNVSYRGLFMSANGSVFMNAEEYFMTTHTSFDSNGVSRTNTIHHFNDIISAKISENGKMDWARNIQKSQTGIIGSSYTSTVKDEEVYFFINCSDKIKQISGNRILFKDIKTKKSNLYAIKIDKNGDFDYNSIVDDKDSEVSFSVDNGVLSSNGDNIIFLGNRKKKKQILKISI